jgi:glycosyltransferase involved in cell wall biosynthesis
MKILLLSTNADLAGAPLHVREIASFLVCDGHDVLVVFGSDGLTRKALIDVGVKTHIVKGMRSSINPLQDLIVYQSLLRLVKSERPDIIHCHSAKAGMIGRLVAAHLKIPSVYTVHGWGFGSGRKPLVGFILKAIEQTLKRFTMHFIAVSESDRKVGIRDLKIPSPNITTIRNGVSYSVSDPDLRPIDAKVIMVARNEYPKDYITFAKALAESTVQSALLVGGGTDDPEFKATIDSTVAGKCKIQYCGLRTDVQSLLESASIFVLSSRYEALPLSIIEAMSKGLPIVASDVGGVRELVTDGVNGFLFPAGDNMALAKHLDVLAKDIELRRRMGLASICRYQNEFSADRMMAQVYDVYKLVLKGDDE